MARRLRQLAGLRKRVGLLTPLGFAVFGGSLLLVLYIGRLVDSWLSFPLLLPGMTGNIIGGVLVALGGIVCGICVLYFVKAKGTPVPINPPKSLIIDGPYAWSRNPMVTGVFAGLFGVGFLFHSVGIVVFTTPIYVLLHVLELKLLEEPDLRKRYGASFLEYKRQVPMFVPRPWRHVTRNNV
jgi:protein-S-isoprenylcysteine O-methyltransferase Ste14